MNKGRIKAISGKSTLAVKNPGWKPSEFLKLSENERNRVCRDLASDGCDRPEVDCLCDCRIDCKKD